jgi:hypothetical protein
MHRGHWGGSWDRSHRWGRNKGCKDSKQQSVNGEGPQDSGLGRGEREDCKALATQRCEVPLPAESGSQQVLWQGPWEACLDWAAGDWRKSKTDRLSRCQLTTGNCQAFMSV